MLQFITLALKDGETEKDTWCAPSQFWQVRNWPAVHCRRSLTDSTYTTVKAFFPYTDNILVCFSSLYFYSSVSISDDAAFSYMMACSDEHSHHGTFFSYGITAATFVNTCILKQSEWKTKMILFSCLNSPELAEVLSEDFQGFLQEVLNGVTFLHLKQKYTNGEKTKAWGEKPVCKVLLRTVQITFFFSLKTSVPVGSIFTLTVFRCPEPSQ